MFFSQWSILDNRMNWQTDFIQYISGWLFERNREQWGNGIRSIDAKLTQTTNPIVNMTMQARPVALFLSNNHPEMYCIRI